ncbi:MAG: GNAT family N-acetyltransferase [Bacteroidales bacterium]
MITSKINYTTKTATTFNIEGHLTACKENFTPPLNETIDIEAYSFKIYKFAVTFEAWYNNQLVGLIAAYFNDEINKTAFITNVSVLKSFQGFGIASALLKKCIEYAKKNNMQKIALEVHTANSSAINLYRKFCFIENITRSSSKMIFFEKNLYI